MRAFRALAALTLLCGLLALMTGTSTAAKTVTAGVAAPQPNIVVVMTDDQRPNTFQTMPVVRQQLRNLGAQFTGVIPTSTCCPSRSSFLTGNLSHNTGVYDNTLSAGGWPAFNASGYESRTLATALQSTGYRTGLVGKYLNYWNQAPEGFVPPGWDVFRAIYRPRGQGAAAYYDYELRGTQPTEVFGSTPDDYSTDVLADRAVQFVQDTPADQPLFLLFTPTAPHEPSTPAPRDKGSWSPSSRYRNDAVNERDMSDKPSFLQNLPKVDRAWIDHAQDKMGESLIAVDDAVRRLIKVLGPRMDNTLFVFMSDNGVMWGEHRLVAKNKPYRWSTDVPMLMRWDGQIAPGTVPSLAANVDVTATILDAAGSPNALATEGISLLGATRKSVLLEATDGRERPAYCGVRMKNWMYVEYSADAGSELYDYRNDPLELHNITDDPAAAGTKARLRQTAQTLCTPTPPGFTW